MYVLKVYLIHFLGNKQQNCVILWHSEFISFSLTYKFILKCSPRKFQHSVRNAAVFHCSHTMKSLQEGTQPIHGQNHEKLMTVIFYLKYKSFWLIHFVWFCDSFRQSGVVIPSTPSKRIQFWESFHSLDNGSVLKQYNPIKSNVVLSKHLIAKPGGL